MAINLIGIAESYKKNLRIIAGDNDPQTKISPVGFLQMLLENNIKTRIDEVKRTGTGHNHEVKLRYMKRGTKADVTDRDDCLTPLSPIWGEATINRTFFSKIGISIKDRELRDWETEASKGLSIGDPSASVSNAMYQTMLSKLQGMFQKINENLLLTQSTKWGINAKTSSSAPQSVTFSNGITIGDGVMKLIRDFQFNEMIGTPLIVGNGSVIDYNMAQMLKVSTDLQGFGRNTTWRAYEDLNSISAWGDNHFGVFAEGSVGFVDFQKYAPGFSHDTGSSIKFRLPFPVMLSDGSVIAMTFDAQLVNNPCNVYDDDDNLLVEEGWGFILSKSYGLFTAPDDMYQSTDRLSGVNGSFHYIGAAQNGTIVAPADGSIWPIT
ncbi:hypothetical protein CLV62_1257 [Dysgonomonas alginatilytica]|uniref:Uncharacterized protein n=1 Tax=Dysgonomonas alginatilytica TaxID=1605892 RepID=A0A2V3PLW5_9BACT|nr:hypothetical protein [Dysgonomonas alginatilytica]PXV61174.1 hypothetical protein CLV62_1257 [Dysgonomonas alginatilytica]